MPCPYWPESAQEARKMIQAHLQKRRCKDAKDIACLLSLLRITRSTRSSDLKNWKGGVGKRSHRRITILTFNRKRNGRQFARSRCSAYSHLQTPAVHQRRGPPACRPAGCSEVERLTAARFWPSASTPWDSQAITLQVLNSHRSRWACSVGWNVDNSCGCWQWCCSGQVVRSSGVLPKRGIYRAGAIGNVPVPNSIAGLTAGS
jgi:hypothetical protein